MELEDFSDDNSEIRYLTIELMKLADRNKISFKKIVDQYIENTFYLQTKIYSVRSFAKGKINAKKRPKRKKE